MAIFSEESIQRVRESNDIVSVVESYFPLKRSGSRFMALCPFHNEKTPSFTVNPELQLYKCFGCGEGGDIFRFVMKLEGLTFPESVEMLAERAGIQLETVGTYDEEKFKQAADDKKALYKINSLALSMFEKKLLEKPEGEAGYNYLLERGFTPQTIKTWRMGWAPEGYNNFKVYLEEELKDNERVQAALKYAITAGIVKEGDREPYDFFRGRVMFPIIDIQNRPIAFGGRILKEDPEKRVGKYMNSPETPLFSKSRVLFGLNAAAKEIRLKGYAIIVEGYTDVIMCHQFGIRNVVATLGTALTNEHVKLLRRYADRVIARFDGDEAGNKATDKAIRIFVEEDMPLQIIRSVEIKDACEFLPKYGTEPFLAEIEKAEDAFTYHINKCFASEDVLTVDQKAQAIQDAMAVVNLSPVPVKREMLRKKVASVAGVSEESLPKQAKKFNSNRQGFNNNNSSGEMSPRFGNGNKYSQNRGNEYRNNNYRQVNVDPALEPKVKTTSPEMKMQKRLLSFMLSRQDWCDTICEALPPEEFCSGAMCDIAAEIHDAWNNNAKLNAADILQNIQNEDASSILSELTMEQSAPLKDEELDETLHFLKISQLKAEEAKLLTDIIKAQESGNIELADTLTREKSAITRELHEMKQKKFSDGDAA